VNKLLIASLALATGAILAVLPAIAQVDAPVETPAPPIEPPGGGEGDTELGSPPDAAKINNPEPPPFIETETDDS
jgi:hypothetical protein